MSHDPYAPKRNPAAEIHDLHPKPLSWLRRNVPDETMRDLPSAAFETPAPAVEYEVEQPPAPLRPEPKPARKPTDLEQIAGWVKWLTYSDMKAFAIEVLGEAKVESPGDLADLFEAWSKRKLEAFASKEQAA